MTILLREAIGDRLRYARTTQRRTLRDVSRTARVSLGYLSEVERGQKEASSELLAAICGALELSVPDLLHHVANDMSVVEQVQEETAAVDRAPDRHALRDSAVVPPLTRKDLSDLRVATSMVERFGATDSARGGVVVAA